MRNPKVIVAACFAVSSLAWGQTQIYRCEGSEGVVYSDIPCAAAEIQTAIGAEAQTSVGAVKKVKWQADKRLSGPVTARLAESPVYANRLFIGMTDTQVLNLATWGRPSQIVRSKAGRVWREQWIYKDRASGRDRGYLFFENSRLVDQEEPLAEPLAPMQEVLTAQDD